MNEQTITTVAAPETFTGNRALDIEEALIFETGRPEVTGVDLDEPAAFTLRLGGLSRKAPIGLPGLTEPEAVRHYVRLSHKNYGIDSGMFPLGSCTMKHNPRLNEKMARLPGFGAVGWLPAVVQAAAPAAQVTARARQAAPLKARRSGIPARASPEAVCPPSICRTAGFRNRPGSRNYLAEARQCQVSACYGTGW